MSRDFRPQFFHDSNPSGPLINRLKYFRIVFLFRRDIRIFKKLLGVHPTAGPKCTQRSQNQNLSESLGAFNGSIRRNPFRGEQFYHVRKDLKKKIIFAKTKILTPRCEAHRRVEFFELCDRISQRNRNRIQKYFSLFIRGPDGFE